jgi:membrane protein YqaA with SNARE-associated domain
MHDLFTWLQDEFIPFLGPVGIFIVAFIDSSFLSIPEMNDICVVTSAAGDPSSAWLYVLVTTTGSVLGCCALWYVGKRGGEPLLVRKYGEERVSKVRTAFRRWDVLAIAIPAVLPPPMPFKIFVFSAGVFGVPFARFALTVAVARGARYSAWGIMGVLYGAAAMDYLKQFDSWFQANAPVVGAIVLISLLLVVLVARRRRQAASSSGA